MDEMRISLPCPKCGKGITKMISELEVANVVICPVCGTGTDVANEPWREAIRAARLAAGEFDPKFS